MKNFTWSAAALLSLLTACVGAPDAADAPQNPAVDAISVTAHCSTVADCAPSRSPCTAARCVLGVCTYTLVGTVPPVACNDNNPCTFNDRCVGALCTGDRELSLLSGAQLPAAEGWVGYGAAAAATSQVRRGASARRAAARTAARRSGTATCSASRRSDCRSRSAHSSCPAS